MFNTGDIVSIKSTGQVFQVTEVKIGLWSKKPMVRILDNGTAKWYSEAEVEKANV